MSSNASWETVKSSNANSNSSLGSFPQLESDSDSDFDPLFDNIEKINEIEKMLAIDPNIIYDPACIKKRSSWSKLKKEHNLIDDGKFHNDNKNPNTLLRDMQYISPKANSLFENIKRLDEKDKKDTGKLFKHFIFTDYVKPMASAMIANGYTLGYTATRTGEGNKKNFDKIRMVPKTDDSDIFYVMTSSGIFEQSLNVKFKKELFAKFNERPANIHGENARFILMDSGFKEGVDLFDIKYIHIFEPQLMTSDLKQIIGRGTRTCGQKGLEFHPTLGWQLHTFIYDMTIPDGLLSGVGTAFALYMKAMNMDTRLLTFSSEIENETITGSVDYDLNRNIHSGGEPPARPPSAVNVGGNKCGLSGGGGTAKCGLSGGGTAKCGLTGGNGSYSSLIRQYIKRNFSQYAWAPTKMENLCLDSGGSSSAIALTPTQNFLKNYFVPSNPTKGMLLWHSTGSGKTCSAIATASSKFEQDNYTILWVTRATLKNDIWKNMFDQVCHQVISVKLSNEGIAIPSEQPKRMKLLSKSWRIRPMSYKQFTNLVDKKNLIYDRLVKINGDADPLRKTLLIIDEAHKLYGGAGLSSLEQPNMVALHAAIMNSYALSGSESVRVLLMTATPITANPMELVKLLNLCKPIEEQMPVSFDEFAAKYLDVDTGKFKAGSKYKDDIAGMVSYLNREKDARQFAQPVIKYIKTPIVKMTDVEKFDKRSMRELLNTDIPDMKLRIEQTNKTIIADLDVNRFKELKANCNAHPEIKRECATIAKRNMRELVSEAKQAMDKIRDEIKDMREELKNKNLFKRQTLKALSDNLDISSPEYNNFMMGVYSSIKRRCTKPIRNNDFFKQFTDKHPSIIPYIDAIDKVNQDIENSENLFKTAIDIRANKLQEMKKMSRATDLSDIERNVLKLTIKDHQKTTRKLKSQYAPKLKTHIERANKTKKRIEKSKVQQIRELKTAMRLNLREEKADQREFKRADKKLRIAMRAQDDYKEEIKDDILKGLMDKYKIAMNVELDEKKEELADKIKERQANKTRKAQEQQANKTRKAQEQQANKTRKAQEQQQRKSEEKQYKLEEKALKKKVLQTRKIHEKYVKALEKRNAA